MPNKQVAWRKCHTPLSFPVLFSPIHQPTLLLNSSFPPCRQNSGLYCCKFTSEFLPKIEKKKFESESWSLMWFDSRHQHHHHIIGWKIIGHVWKHMKILEACLKKGNRWGNIPFISLSFVCMEEKLNLIFSTFSNFGRVFWGGKIHIKHGFWISSMTSLCLRNGPRVLFYLYFILLFYRKPIKRYCGVKEHKTTSCRLHSNNQTNWPQMAWNVISGR